MTPEQFTQLLDDLQVNSRLMKTTINIPELAKYKLEIDKIKSQLYTFFDKSMGDADIAARLDDEITENQRKLEHGLSGNDKLFRNVIYTLLLKIRDGAQV